MKRHWRLGMTGHVSVIVVVGVVLILAGGAIAFLHERTETAKRYLAASKAERIVSLAGLFDEATPEEHAILIRALNTRYRRARIVPQKPALRRDMPKDLADIVRMMERNLSARLERPFDIGILDGPARLAAGPLAAGRFVPAGTRPGGDRRGGPRARLAVAVQQQSGNWLVLHSSTRLGRLKSGQRLIYVILGAALLVLGVTVWAVHRVTRPLRQFAAASDRFGVDLRAPSLAEQGAREVRMATRAFNRMQSRLRRLVDDRTLMLAAISHDLRTVLTRLQLRAEFIDDEKQREKAVADIGEMQAMLESTLSFARDDTAEEARTDLDLSAMLQSLCDDMSDMGHKADYQGPTGLTCRCQPIALRRAVNNLLINAAKYGGEASVTARREGNAVLIEIGDRGPGIPEEMREQVFAPFFRLEQSRNRETGGSGLGLAVARSIVRRHGGDITLHDRPGGGLLARVSLPVAVDGDP